MVVKSYFDSSSNCSEEGEDSLLLRLYPILNFFSQVVTGVPTREMPHQICFKQATDALPRRQTVGWKKYLKLSGHSSLRCSPSLQLPSRSSSLLQWFLRQHQLFQAAPSLHLHQCLLGWCSPCSLRLSRLSPMQSQMECPIQLPV